MPAQWQKYPLKTQEELRRGRDSLNDVDKLQRCIDEGVSWLHSQFPNSGYTFSTKLDGHFVTLTVSKIITEPMDRNGLIYQKTIEAFTVREHVASFVSHATVTKLILIA